MGALAAALGWAVIVPERWRGVIWPRAEAEWLTLPALVMAGVAGARRRGRWWTVAAVWFGAWWLASSLAGRVEFWRVEFGALTAAWVLTRCGADVPRRGMAAGLAVFGGVWVGGGAAPWTLVALVPVAVCVGLAAGGAEVVQPGLLMLGFAGVDLGAGRAVRGGLGVVDLSCLGALVAPLAVPLVERRLRVLGWAAGAGSALVVAGGVVGLAWVVERAVH